jgi:hypothetical protein
MTARRWGVMAILLVASCFAAIAVRWADGEFRRIEPPVEEFHSVSRPDWVWAMHRPYRRVENAWIWVCSAVSLAMGALVTLDGRWRRPWPSGTIIVLVALMVGILTTAHFFLAAPAMFKTNGLCYGLRNALEFRVPGAILGALVVTWGRKVDWRGRMIVGVWAVEVGMLVAYGVLFG